MVIIDLIWLSNECRFVIEQTLLQFLLPLTTRHRSFNFMTATREDRLNLSSFLYLTIFSVPFRLFPYALTHHLLLHTFCYCLFFQFVFCSRFNFPYPKQKLSYVMYTASKYLTGKQSYWSKEMNKPIVVHPRCNDDYAY